MVGERGCIRSAWLVVLSVAVRSVSIVILMIKWVVRCIWGVILVDEQVVVCVCPFCKQPVNIRDYGKEVWKDAACVV